MLPKTKKFYELTKVDNVLDDPGEDVPITWTQVFYKTYPRLKSIGLSKTKEDEGELETLLQHRESTRIFSDNSLSFDEISKVLRSCRIVDPKRGPERRTYPSGGARFPVELYLVAFNIDDIEKGLYHYNIKEGKLELLWEKDLRNKRRELISPYLENPAATIVFTSVISRSEVKYGHKAYPFSFIEAGHMGQNILLTATEIGLGACPVSGFVDKTLIEILDLTEGEIPIYTICLGKRKRL